MPSSDVLLTGKDRDLRSRDTIERTDQTVDLLTQQLDTALSIGLGEWWRNAREGVDWLGYLTERRVNTDALIEDLREAAQVVKGRHVAPNVKLALVVPGSGLVKAMAEQEGLDKIFLEAGFEWREPGCSMCLAMNDDRLMPGERCASTSNRNFEGRQGPGGRTHLVSPAMAAAAAIAGHFVDVRELN